MMASIEQAEAIRAEQAREEREQREAEKSPAEPDYMQAVWADAFEREKLLRSYTT
jgi:hypothetical protein